MQQRVELIIQERLRADAPVAWAVAGDGWRLQPLRNFYSDEAAFSNGLAALAVDLSQAGLPVDAEVIAQLRRLTVLELSVEQFVLRVAGLLEPPEEDTRTHRGANEAVVMYEV